MQSGVGDKDKRPLWKFLWSMVIAWMKDMVLNIQRCRHGNIYFIGEPLDMMLGLAMKEWKELKMTSRNLTQALDNYYYYYYQHGKFEEVGGECWGVGTRM